MGMQERILVLKMWYEAVNASKVTQH